MTGENVMEYKGYYGTVEYSAKDDVLFGKVIGVRGLISYEGESVQSLKADFEEAIDDYLETNHILNLKIDTSPSVRSTVSP